MGEAQYNKGKKDGTWTVWDDNGTKRCEMNYDNDTKVGTWKVWDDKGKLLSEKTF